MRFFLHLATITECWKLQKSHHVTRRRNLRFCYLHWKLQAKLDRFFFLLQVEIKFKQSSKEAERVTSFLQLDIFLNV